MALKLEKANKETKAPELAATYLNLCAIYSELNLHGEAIEKAVKSVLIIKTYLKKLNHESMNSDLDKVVSAEGQSKFKETTKSGSHSLKQSEKVS